LGVGLAASCARSEAATDSDGRIQSPRRILTITGARDPESVRYDAEQDVFFISMMNGHGSYKDDNGYILRVPAANATQQTIFAESGKRGVTLHAPKGMAIHGDTLWVADIDVLRGFDRRTGAAIATVDFASLRPTLLNDVAIGPDNRIYVTDTGIWMTEFGVIYKGGDRLFVVGPGGSISVAAEGARLGRPNGITWDDRGQRWLLVNFDPWTSTLAVWKPGETTFVALTRGKGKWDGVEALGDGRILVSSWTDSSVHVFRADGHRLGAIHPIAEPADIGFDTRRNRVAIPVSVMGRVEVWAIP
jgi:sugar lactone lactonase YvrE